MLLAQIPDVSDIAKGTKDLAGESYVLATMLLLGIFAFVVLRYAAWPVLRTVLDIMKEINGITHSLKGMVERVERAADKLDDHQTHRHAVSYAAVPPKG